MNIQTVYRGISDKEKPISVKFDKYPEIVK